MAGAVHACLVVLLAAHAWAATIQPVYTATPAAFTMSNVVDTVVKSGFNNNNAFIITKQRWLPDGRLLYSTRNCTFFMATGSVPITSSFFFSIPSCQSPGEIGYVALAVFFLHALCMHVGLPACAQLTLAALTALHWTPTSPPIVSPHEYLPREMFPRFR